MLASLADCLTAPSAPRVPRASLSQTAALYLLGSFEALEESGDQTTQSTAIVLRFLPFMLGWFAMNAPAGLGLYWVFNNILTTTSTVTIKKILEKPPEEIKVGLAPRHA